MTPPHLTKSAGIAFALCLPALSSGALISFENFGAYTGSGRLSTLTAPATPGYSGNWYDNSGSFGPTLKTPLVYGDAAYQLGSTGQSVGFSPSGSNGRNIRLFDGSLTATSGTTGTYYFSFLITQGGAQFQNLELFSGGNADANRTFYFGATNNAGMDQTKYSFSAGGQSVQTPVTANAAVNLVVVKFTLSSVDLSDTVSVWVNPDLSNAMAGDSSSTPLTISGANIAFDRLSLASFVTNNDNLQVGNLAWGTDFASVTVVPIPEPTSYAAIACGGVGLAAVIRRRKRRASN